MTNRCFALLSAIALSACVARAGGGPTFGTSAGGPLSSPPGEPPPPAYGPGPMPGPGPAATPGPAPAPAPDVAFPPGRWSLGQRETWNALYNEMRGSVDLMNQTCGTQITFSFDHEQLRPFITEDGLVYDARSSLGAVVDVLRSTCSTATPDVKQLIKSRVRTIVIGHASDRRHRLDGHTVYATIDLTENPSKFWYAAEAWLRAAL